MDLLGRFRPYNCTLEAEDFLGFERVSDGSLVERALYSIVGKVLTCLNGLTKKGML